MPDLIELVIQQAEAKAQQLGGRNIHITQGHLDIRAVGDPRYRVTNSRTLSHNLHRESIDNCTLSAITRRLNIREQRSYQFDVTLDLSLGLRQSLQLTLSETLTIPGYREHMQLQGMVVFDVRLGERLHGSYSETRTYTDDTALVAPPCTRTEFAFDVQERELAGEIDVDVEVRGEVSVYWRIANSNITVSTVFPIEIDTTATGTFNGLVAVDVDRALSQTVCREGLCASLRDDQLWRLWGLEGEPESPLPGPAPDGRDRTFPSTTTPGCGNAFTVEAIGSGDTEDEAERDAQQRADAGAEGTCPIECAEARRFDWDVSSNEPDGSGQWWCIGKGHYTCEKEE